MKSQYVRKLLVIDDQVTYLGGFNLDRRNSRRAVGSSRWRDNGRPDRAQCGRRRAELPAKVAP